MAADGSTTAAGEKVEIGTFVSLQHMIHKKPLIATAHVWRRGPPGLLARGEYGHGVDVEISIVDALVIVLDVLEHHGLAAMLHQCGRSPWFFIQLRCMNAFMPWPPNHSDDLCLRGVWGALRVTLLFGITERRSAVLKYGPNVALESIGSGTEPMA
jgi:hypothetical protein